MTLPDESTIECQRYFIAFSFTLSQIQQHICRVTKRQEAQKDKRNDSQILEENMALLQLQVAIENDIMHLPVNLNYNSTKQQFPALEEDASTSQISPMTRLLHMLYHLNVILLHYHYFIYPLPQGSHPTTNYQHRQMCTHSASTMIRLVEGLLAEPTHAFRYGPRGLSFVTHCITSALTVLRIESTLVKDSSVLNEEYQRCTSLVQRVTSASPVYHHLENASSPMTTKRRNTISERPRLNTVPHTLLQSSSTNVQFHQPLHNLHAAPLQIPQQPQQPPQRTLRGTTQSCQDLRSMQQMHVNTASFTQHRKPVSSVISSSTVSTLPYRGNSNGSSISGSRNVSPNLPYGKPQQYMVEPSQSTGYLHTRQQQQQGKIRRIKKSQSIHGISNTYQRHQLPPQQQQQQLFQPSFQQQSQQQLFYTPSPTQQQPILHRPYQPSYDDMSTDKFMTTTTTATEVDDFTVDNMNMDFNFLNSLDIDHFSNRTESQPLL